MRPTGAEIVQATVGRRAPAELGRIHCLQDDLAPQADLPGHRIDDRGVDLACGTDGAVWRKQRNAEAVDAVRQSFDGVPFPTDFPCAVRFEKFCPRLVKTVPLPVWSEAMTMLVTGPPKSCRAKNSACNWVSVPEGEKTMSAPFSPRQVRSEWRMRST